MAEKRLTKQEMVFCYRYGQTRNCVQAAIHAGIAPEQAERVGVALLAKQDIQNQIREFCKIDRESLLCRAVAGLERLAFGSTNDAVRLLKGLELPAEQIGQLDLFGVSGIKQGKDGMDIQFFDRLSALKALAELAGQQGGTEGALPFYKALLQEEMGRTGNMMDLRRFSPKQKRVLTWWCRQGKTYDAVICDGAVRSGKTLCLSLSFAMWAMCAFSGQNFALCGRSIASVRRNVLESLLEHLKALGFSCKEKTSRNLVEICWGNRKNRFYLFGGKDETSAAQIQGITLAGVLLDEVALMPRSFVEQAIARCSVEGSKLWFSCNPEHPYHWFYREWIQKAKEKNALYLHFTMEDNPSLSPQMRKRYESLYSGAFYQRFVLGRWSAPQGLVYPMFSPEKMVVDKLPEMSAYWISCDYGTVNPFSLGLWGERDGIYYRIREFYHNSRQTGRMKTDGEYYEDLCRLADGLPIKAVIVDPSAASFLTLLRQKGQFRCVAANNDVLLGIRRTGEMLRQGRLRFHESCQDILREFQQYVWDSNAGKDVPRKEWDHAMDDMRYFVMTVCVQQDWGICTLSASR